MNDPAEHTPEYAIQRLAEIFSKPDSRPHLRCCTDGPTEIDFAFETAIDEVSGANRNSEYKSFVRRLYCLGLIPKIPPEWETPEACAPVSSDADLS